MSDSDISKVYIGNNPLDLINNCSNKTAAIGLDNLQVFCEPLKAITGSCSRILPIGLSAEGGYGCFEFSSLTDPILAVFYDVTGMFCPVGCTYPTNVQIPGVPSDAFSGVSKMTDPNLLLMFMTIFTVIILLVRKAT